MPAPPPLHDLACVAHLHSTYSDGTGTVPEIAAAGRRAGVDVVLLTDHDTLEAKERGEEGWYGSVLLLVGEEVSPSGGDHYLAFGIDEVIRHRRLKLDAEGIMRAVAEAGGFGFAAHPFSEGSVRFNRPGMPFSALDSDELHGIELWSFVTDSAERVASIPELIRFVLRPESVVDHPPRENMEAWDRLCQHRRVVALGGLDAHQIGRRIGNRFTIRLMSYSRSFRYLRTHALCEELPDGDLAHDREQVYAALRDGRCYIARDALAPALGFSFWADGPGGTLPMGPEESAGEWTLHVSAPRPAELRLVRDGQEVARANGATLEYRANGPGVYRVEAQLDTRWGMRTWILSNPIYLR